VLDEDILKIKGIQTISKYEPERIFNETENLKKQWKTDLVHLVRELPDFDVIMTELKEKLAFLF
jgi:hypothetical protein